MDKLQHFPVGSEQHIEHPADARIGIHPFPDTLYCVTMVENPLRWRSRYWNYWAFEKQFLHTHVVLYTVEVAFGDRKFEVTSPDNPHHIQLRTKSEIWHKENALNLAFNRLPLEAQYIAWIDSDLQFVRSDWAQETLHLLQHYDAVQMFSHLIDVGPNTEPIRPGAAVSLVYLRETHPELKIVGTNERRRRDAAEDYSGIGSWGCPGGAWAYRRSALTTLGGLIDWMVTGAGDFWMAKGLYGEIEDVLNDTFSPELKQFALSWQEGALELKRNFGYVPGTVNHYWHGKKAKRGYDRRRGLLDQFNPLTDIRRNVQGIYELVSKSTFLRDGLRVIARSRDEDSNSIE